MSESPAPPRLKVSRPRSRLYQLAPAVDAAALPEPSPADSATEAAVESAAALALDARMQRQRRWQRRRAINVLHYHAALSGTAGVLPLPVLDTLLVGSLQLNLIHDLSRLYGVDFSTQRAKAAIAALLGGMQSGLLVSSMLKYVPVVGYAVVSIPAAAAVGAVTYAIGKVFMYHFELGGTLLDFDADQLRGYFKRQLKR